MVSAFNRRLVACNDVGLLAVALQAGFNYGKVTVEIGFLFKIPYAYVVAHGYFAAFVRFLSSDYLEQCALSLAVACNESNALAFLNGKRDVIEQHKVTETL